MAPPGFRDPAHTGCRKHAPRTARRGFPPGGLRAARHPGRHRRLPRRELREAAAPAFRRRGDRAARRRGPRNGGRAQGPGPHRHPRGIEYRQRS